MIQPIATTAIYDAKKRVLIPNEKPPYNRFKQVYVVFIPEDNASTKGGKSSFTPEQETLLLKQTGLYTDEFIKKNRQVKRNIDRAVTCKSLKELKQKLERRYGD